MADEYQEERWRESKRRERVWEAACASLTGLRSNADWSPAQTSERVAELALNDAEALVEAWEKRDV